MQLPPGILHDKDVSGPDGSSVLGANDAWECPTVAAARSAVKREFIDWRSYLRRPDFDPGGAEGYVLQMCRNYILPLVLARGREVLGEEDREEDLRAFTAAELAKLEQIHWSPARHEFGDRCFTSVEFQRRFESMIRRELESKVLPEVARASSGADELGHGGRGLPNDSAGPGQAASGCTERIASEAGWQAVKISFLSDERIQISHGSRSETCNYAEFGFCDGRNGKPNRAWGMLRVLAQTRGLLRNGANTAEHWRTVEKRIQEIRKILRQRFAIAGDPLPFIEGTGYQAVFKIECSPSFEA